MKTITITVTCLLASLIVALAQQEPSTLSEPTEGSEALTPEVQAIFTPAVVMETIITRQDGRDIIVQRLALDPKDPIEPVITEFPIAMAADAVSMENEQIAPETTPDLSNETPVSIPNSMIPAEELAYLDAFQSLLADETANPAAVYAEPEQDNIASESEVDSADEEEHETEDVEEFEAEDEEAPSQPKDLIIRYRIAETPLPTTAAEGSAP